jgi:F0F1-type ATP synthase epsilon subunit
MKKTFPLSAPGKHPDRLVDAIKNELRKYLRRENNRALPEGADYWDFDCRFGKDEENLEPIKPGELVVTKGGKTTHLAVGEGFVEITGDKVSVLVDMALTEEAIDEKAAEEAVKRAEARLKEEHIGDEESALVQAAIAKSLAQLHVKRRRRSV